MKRFMVWWMLGVGALGVACTQSAQSSLYAGLSGTYDLSLVGAQLFVTSADRNELRVLELAEDATQRRFARAPNPLEPLAIPVLPRPQALAHDVRYDANGQEQAGPFVYARSSGSTLISVVSVAELHEVRRLDTRQLTASLTPPAAGPVTAIAALAPASEGAPSTLYFATQETTGARLWRVLLPAALESFEGPFDVKGFGPQTTPLAATEAVSSLLVLPQTGRLGVSTLRGERLNPGRSFTLDVEAGGPEQGLDFGGAQVLKLATHGRINGAEGQPARLAEGARIFGVLDPSNCVTQPCVSGVLAVESSSGTLAKDSTGYPMLPINSGTGLPMGLSLSTSTGLTVQAGEPRPDGAARGGDLPLLGIVPLSTGGLLFFDALNLTQLNTAAAWSEGQTPNTATATLSLVDVVGASVDASADLAFEGTYGTTRDETYVLTYQGALPGMTALSRDLDSTTFTVPTLTEAGGAPAVRPGDLIVLMADASAQQPCATDLVVREVRTATPAAGQDVLVPEGAVPEACASYGYFQVRVAGTQPLVLSGPGESYIQRLGTGDTFTRSRSYYFHPPGYQGQSEGTSVFIRVLRNLEDTNRPLARGVRFVVTTASHYYPYLIVLDLTYQDLQRFRLPGPVVRARVGDTDYAYIVYPSANGVLQVTLTSLSVGVANSQGMFPYQ